MLFPNILAFGVLDEPGECVVFQMLINEHLPPIASQDESSLLELVRTRIQPYMKDHRGPDTRFPSTVLESSIT